jgi:excinuclease UvrABC nuclease subunit
VELAAELNRQMLAAAEALDFETAARLRDRLRELDELPQLKSDNGNDKRDRKKKTPAGPGKGPDAD